MARLQPTAVPARRAPGPRNTRRRAAAAAIVLLAGVWPGASRSLSADLPLVARPDPYRASTGLAARQNAVQAIPIEKLDPEARARVASVLSNISIFRRLPIGVVNCDPDLYLFLVRHPDVVVNIWEVLKVSRLKLRQIGPDTYQVSHPAEGHENGPPDGRAGTLATVEFLYRSHDTHVVYAEGSYDGPLAAGPVKGRCLMVLRSGYVRETDGRYYITSRLDTFVCVEPGGIELLAKTFQPLVGKVADHNFLQSVAFLGSLSRTAEVNTEGVQRVAAKLTHVQPELRQRLCDLAAEVARKYAAASASSASSPPQVAVRDDADTRR
jgi:hypothetical protein